MQTNLTTNAVTVKGNVTPEIHEALKTLRQADWRLEAEYFAFDWDARLELAEELRATLDDLDDRQADVIASVAEDLDDEAEDFSTWETRSDAASRVRTVIRSLKEKAAYA